MTSSGAVYEAEVTCFQETRPNQCN